MPESTAGMRESGVRMAMLKKPWMAFSTYYQYSRVSLKAMSGQRSSVRLRLTLLGAM
jgi:hypothetical protein